MRKKLKKLEIKVPNIKEEKFLKFSIKKMFDLYVLSLQMMVEVQKLAKEKMEISKKKYLATKQDLSPNTKFVNNRLIKKAARSNAVVSSMFPANIRDQLLGSNSSSSSRTWFRLEPRQ